MRSLKAVTLYGTILVLAIALTIGSLSFVRPVNCRSYCDASDRTPCPAAACRGGEQRAGLPLPVVVDSGAGSSPTGGWGILGPEDLPNPLTFTLDVCFYAVVLRLAFYRLPIRHREPPMDRRVIAVSWAMVVLVLLGGLALYWSLLTR